MYPGWQKDKNNEGYTPLMFWIKYVPEEFIPKELYYDGYQMDKDNHDRTPLMLWIEYHEYKKDIPEKLYYDGC